MKNVNNEKALDEIEELMKSIVVKAGKATLAMFGKVGVKYTKTGLNDVVTEADLLSSKIIIAAIKKRFPEHGIISEEEKDHNTDADYLWYVDPLDGTRNFSKSTPMYGVMIACAYKNQIVVAAIYNPYFKELYNARKGKGAYKNGKRIYCSKFPRFVDSNGIMGSIWSIKRKYVVDNIFNALNDETIWLQSLGSVAYSNMLVADGRRDWLIGRGGGIWDYAPASLILREAGCKITNLKGEEWTLKDVCIVATNPKLHKELLKLTKGW